MLNRSGHVAIEHNVSGLSVGGDFTSIRVMKTNSSAYRNVSIVALLPDYA